MDNQNNNNNGANRLVLDRRRFVEYLSVIGIGSTLLPGALSCGAQDSAEITADMVKSAAKLAGLEFSPEHSAEIARRLSRERGLISQYEAIRELNIDNSVAPAFGFNPVPAGMKLPTEQKPFKRSRIRASMPGTDEELAFLPVTHLSKLIESRQITPTELTKLYLARLKKYDPTLLCVVSLTEELALEQAQKAEEEIAAGNYRGPLHGIPYGIKDLFAVKGYKTTWGASPYRDRVIDVNCTVFNKLTEAGAILVAKLSSGALAAGANWFRGTTRNPWNPELNSYGSSAGPASAAAGGLVGFAIGTETAGSITSPASACGLSGMRPTYGRISRYGCMALSWTMDKVGPLCRSAEDCALVFHAIYGPDGKDNMIIDVPFNWDGSTDLSGLRVGFWPNIVEREDPVDEDHSVTGQRLELSERLDREAADIIGSLGAKVTPFEMPEMPANLYNIIMSVESAAAFDDLMRTGRVDMMTEEPESSGYPISFRHARFIPAVEYIQANRVRNRLIEEFNEAMSDFDLIIGSDVYLTNLTGHPEISIPHGFYTEGLPTTLRLTGKLFGETEMLKAAHAFQSKTDYHLKHPSLP